MNKAMIDLSRANKPVQPHGEPTSAEEPKVVIAAPEPPNPQKSAVRGRERTKTLQPRTQPAPVARAETPEPISTIAARVPASLHKAVRRYCVEEDLDIQIFVRDALTQHLAMLQEAQE